MLSASAPAVPQVRVVGDPVLRQIATPVPDNGKVPGEVVAAGNALMARLALFRHEHGFGRGIAAPQLGFSVRLICLDLGRGPFLAANPVLTPARQDKFSLWDDCMSFPDTLAAVNRFESVHATFCDLQTGERVSLRHCSRDLSELLQHECDHLDGVLSLDICFARVLKSEYAQDRARYDAMVTPGYSITPICSSDASSAERYPKVPPQFCKEILVDTSTLCSQ